MFCVLFCVCVCVLLLLLCVVCFVLCVSVCACVCLCALVQVFLFLPLSLSLSVCQSERVSRTMPNPTTPTTPCPLYACSGCAEEGPRQGGAGERSHPPPARAKGAAPAARGTRCHPGDDHSLLRWLGGGNRGESVWVCLLCVAFPPPLPPPPHHQLTHHHPLLRHVFRPLSFSCLNLQTHGSL